eukprot:gene31211-40180_t
MRNGNERAEQLSAIESQRKIRRRTSKIHGRSALLNLNEDEGEVGAGHAFADSTDDIVDHEVQIQPANFTSTHRPMAHVSFLGDMSASSANTSAVSGTVALGDSLLQLIEEVGGQPTEGVNPGSGYAGHSMVRASLHIGNMPCDISVTSTSRVSEHTQDLEYNLSTLLDRVEHQYQFAKPLVPEVTSPVGLQEQLGYPVIHKDGDLQLALPVTGLQFGLEGLLKLQQNPHGSFVYDVEATSEGRGVHGTSNEGGRREWDAEPLTLQDLLHHADESAQEESAGDEVGVALSGSGGRECNGHDVLPNTAECLADRMAVDYEYMLGSPPTVGVQHATVADTSRRQ